MVKQKNSGHIKKIQWRIYPLVLLFAITSITGIVTSIITADPAGAISNSDKQYCGKTFKQNDVLANRSPDTQTFTNTAEGDDFDKHSCSSDNFCTTKTQNRNVGGGSVIIQKIVVKCQGVDPSKDPSVIGTQVHDSYNQIVLDKYCPDSMSDQIGCITKVNEATDKCIPTDATSAAIDFDAVAKCLEKNSPSSPKIKASVIEPLLKKAQSSVQADADSAVAKSKCESDPDKSWNPSQNNGQGACVDSGADGESSCKVDGIGWIVCPVMNFMAKIVDQAYNFVSSLLIIQPLTTTGDTKPVYTAWSTMRNIANVAFVIAFMFVIYSQITSVGISNYGIKKMLPRIVVAAILVNVSYWICSIAVDLSNILGGSLRDLLSAPSSTAHLFDSVSSSSSGEGWVGITGLVLAGSIGTVAMLYIGLSALLPALIAALLAIVTVFLVLTLRQALIILLIVVSPLAFVAYLLPNTEQWFKKWRELFQTLLLMFPIIAVIFGASALASKIVMASATGDYKIAIQIMGALISILPLAITPVVMKSAGNLLNKFGAVVNNPNKGPFDRMRKGAEGFRERRQNLRKGAALSGSRRVFGGGQFRRAGTRDLRNKAAEAEAKAGMAAFARHDDKAISLDQQARTANSWASTHDTMSDVAWRQSAAGAAAVQGQMNAESEGKAVKVNAEIQNIRTAPGVRLNLEAAEAQLGAAKAGEKALIEELKTNAGAPSNSALAGVAADLRQATEDEHVLNLRAGSAGRVLQQEQAEALSSSAALQAQAAGIDSTYGPQRIKASATQTLHKAFDDALAAERTTMTDIKINDPTASEDLMRIKEDKSASAERRAAAVSMIAKNGGASDVMKTFDDLGSAMEAANASGDAAEIEAVSSMQKQFMADAGAKLPASVTGKSKGAMGTGSFEGSLKDEIIASLNDGRYSGEKLASIHPRELERIEKILSSNKSALDASKLASLQKSITEYRAAAPGLGKGLSNEAEKPISGIETI